MSGRRRGTAGASADRRAYVLSQLALVSCVLVLLGLPLPWPLFGSPFTLGVWEDMQEARGESVSRRALAESRGVEAASRASAPAPLAPALVDDQQAAADGSALRALEALPVRGRGPTTGYSRQQFGQRWADVDRNGCDTRNDVLRRDLVDVQLDRSTRGCVVLSGRLQDPYTGSAVPFARGTASDVHVDHVVALSDAWQKGAARWPEQMRTAFANDPANLLAVSGRANLQKGDADAATWLPPVRAVRCAYVSAQVRVKSEYGLAVTAAEQEAARRVLRSC